MSTIVTRSGKGSPLSHVEVDANFTNLNTDKIQSGNTVAALTITSATINGGSITGITDLAVADGGTGASDAATARTNLGLAIGTNVQAYDADLTAIAALAPTADNFIVGNGTAWTLETPAQSRTSLGLGTIATLSAPAGTVVGTSDTQTLTNKTIALGSNTVSGTLAQFNTAVTDADLVSLAGTETLTNKTLTSPTLTTPALGTPASGVVTNLTGTASININGTVGATTPAAGAFTTLSASSTVSGTGFSTYLASPPAIGNTAPSTGKFTSVTNTGLTSGRVTYAGTAGLLQDDADFTFNGTTVTMANDASISGLTVGKGGGAVATGTALGYQALNSNSSGTVNTAIGYQAGYTNTTNALTAVGYRAGYLYNTGYETTGSTFIGYSSGVATTSGHDNTFVGGSSGTANTSGSFNIAIGGQALQANTTASNNTAVGYQAGYTNTTGASSTYMGYQAGYTNNANGNVFVGYAAGKLATAVGNTFVGYEAGYNCTGTINTFVGYDAGVYVTTGAKNTIIGGYLGNQGGLDIRTSSNNVVLSDGDGNIAGRWANGGGWYQLNNSASWSTTSDARIKENVTPITNGLDVILALNPVEFDYKLSKQHTAGFIAQDYEKVLPDQIIEDANISEELKALTNGEPVKGIQQNLVPYLVKAIQELKAEVEAQAVEIATLKGL